MGLDSAHNSRTTALRLLEAAGAVFAAKGFRAATVREIIRRAKANVAAVNYHFGDKAALYAATFRHARQGPHGGASVAGLAAGASAEARLLAFVRGLLGRVLRSDRPAWTWQLMMREMAEPTDVGVLDEMVRESVAPDFAMIAGIVREVTGLRAGDARVRMCVASVVGQVLFYRHAQPIWQRLHPEQAYGEAEVAAIARHVVAFSLAGMTALCGSPKPEIRNQKKIRSPRPERKDGSGGSG